MNPIATLHMANGRNIVIELLPESAPNTVNSFIYTASRGYLDHHAIERIVPGNWVDVSYTAFGKKECRYLIPNEFELNPDVVPLDSHPGAVCMGGYGEAGLAGCEFFFPLRDCPDHKGIYPVFGRVLEGMDELYRLEKVETVIIGGADGPTAIFTTIKLAPHLLGPIAIAAIYPVFWRAWMSYTGWKR